MLQTTQKQIKKYSGFLKIFQMSKSQFFFSKLFNFLFIYLLVIIDQKILSANVKQIFAFFRNVLIFNTLASAHKLHALVSEIKDSSAGVFKKKVKPLKSSVPHRYKQRGSVWQTCLLPYQALMTYKEFFSSSSAPSYR